MSQTSSKVNRDRWFANVTPFIDQGSKLSIRNSSELANLFANFEKTGVFYYKTHNSTLIYLYAIGKIAKSCYLVVYYIKNCYLLLHLWPNCAIIGL
jgi:hypothetical protein